MVPSRTTQDAAFEVGLWCSKRCDSDYRHLAQELAAAGGYDFSEAFIDATFAGPCVVRPRQLWRRGTLKDGRHHHAALLVVYFAAPSRTRHGARGEPAPLAPHLPSIQPLSRETHARTNTLQLEITCGV